MPFIAFEGLDGSGKSTLLQGVADQLKSRGREVLTTREPGGTPLGEEIRCLLLEDGPTAPVPRAELLLYQAARAQHVEQVIRPALKLGTWVLCDRFTASTLAFQCGGRGLPEGEIADLIAWTTAHLEPDLTVLLDVSVPTSQARRAHRETQDRFESEQSAFHQRVRDHYLHQVQRDTSSWLVLNGESAKPEELVARTLSCLEAKQWL